MKHTLLLFSFLILAVLPARAQWQDADFEGPQILAFGTHDTSFFLSALPQNDIDSLIWRRNADGGWICHAIGIGLDRTQGNITSFSSLGRYFFAGMTQQTGGPGTAWRSGDNGAHWIANAGGFVCTNGLYMYCVSDGIYRSRDSGNDNTWEKVTPFQATVMIAAGKYVLADAKGPLYRSDDSGASGSWSQVSAPISNISSFALVGTNIYAANGTQLMESTDSGGTWTLVNTGFNVAYLASDSVHLFAGGSSGVYYLDPQSGNWIYESGDTSVLDNRGIVALGVFDTLLFADFASSAHQNYQLFMRSIPEMTEKSGVAAMSQSEDTIVIYPNPAMDRVTIISGGTSIYGVRVLNVLGEEITKTTFRGLGSGNVELDLSKLSTGTYFLEIQKRNGVEFRKIILER